MTRYPRFLPDGRRYVKGDGPLPCDTLFLGAMRWAKRSDR